ncbi:hypothetical protein OBBRIDRAFT_498935 [Obba rivulosa]|uniref:Uncharacterized protein n=1 Tax=Obba rivulosa TaxID=1052685 RepID=A0A8E2DU55_9APHY|nr:hypothetical protein OBBRIDRAFT_498935 [Obba rivulosa]
MTPLPRLVLTLPTPELPRSPIFAPRSPITVSKFVAASFNLATASAASGLHSPIPSIPACGTCSPRHIENEEHCRSCGKQWLACKMWYQATDGGKQQRLAEPFIKPGESNANTRAIMDVLGIPGSRSGLDGLGLTVVPHFPRHSNKRKPGRLLRVRALTSSLCPSRKLSNIKLPGDANSTVANARSLGLPRVKAGRLRSAKSVLSRRLNNAFRVLTSRTRVVDISSTPDGDTRLLLLAPPSLMSTDTRDDDLPAPAAHQLLRSARTIQGSKFVEQLDDCAFP